MRIGIDVTMLQVRQGRHGIGSYLRGLLGGLARMGGHEYALLAWRAPALDLPPLPAQFRVMALPTPAIGRARALFTHQIALPVLARRARLDVLHIPGVAVTASMPSAPLWASVPVVLTVHDLIPLLFPDTVLPRRRHRLFYRLMLRAGERAARIVCDSEATRGDLIGRLGVPAARVSVAPLAAAPSFTPEPVAPENGRAHGVPADFVLHVGGPAPTKNLRGLLMAMSELWDRGLATHLVSVSSLPFDPAALCPPAAPHRARIHVLDEVSDRFLLWLYQRALVLAVPSLYEGFGLPVLEAMGAGCPVIAARVASLPEVGGDAAIYVEVDSTPALAEAIAALLGDSERRAGARAAGLRRAAEFTWERTAAATLAVYEAAGDRA